MSADEEKPDASDEAQVALQRAIRARALDTIERASQPKMSLQRRLLTGALVLLVLLLLVTLIDFGVRVMHHIMQIWGYEEAPMQTVPIEPDRPFYISVEPAQEDQSTPASGDSSSAASK